MANRKGYVYVQDKYAGTIEDSIEGYIFAYDPKYIEEDGAVAVSVTLPITDIPYISPTLFPFFDGLIPEGWLLKVVADKWNINQRDRFGCLLVACKDCIGDVSIREEKT